MGITKFLYFLLFFSIFIIFYDVDKVNSTDDGEEKPLVSFYDTIMYNIDTKNVNHVIPSKEAYLYKGREEMIGGTIVTKEEDTKYIKTTNSLSAESMIKVGNDIYLDGDVNVQMADGTNLKTEQLHYNLKNKIAQNEQKFVVVKGFHDFYGRDLHYDISKKNLKARYTHFKIKVENE